MPHTRIGQFVLVSLVSTALLLSGCNEPRSASAPPADKSAAEPLELNVRDFGAVGDGKTDDSAALQAAFDAAAGSSRRYPDQDGPSALVIPSGTYRIADTLTLDHRHKGLSIRGAGLAKGYGSPVKLVWDGPDGGVLIDMRSAFSIELTDLALIGSMQAFREVSHLGILKRNLLSDIDTFDRAAVCLRINTAGRGGAAAELTLRRIYVSDADTGIEIGGLGRNICGSDMLIEDLGMSHCQTGFRTMKHQNVNFVFIRPQVGNCGTGLHFVEGGSVSAILYSGKKVDRFVKIDHGGINAGNFAFHIMKPEFHPGPLTGKRGAVVEAKGEVNVTFTGLCTGVIGLFGEKGDRESPLFIVGPGAQVQVEGSMISGHIAHVEGDPEIGPAFIRFENCRFRVATDPHRDITANEEGGYSFVDCIYSEDRFDAQGQYKQVQPTKFLDRLTKKPAMPDE